MYSFELRNYAAVYPSTDQTMVMDHDNDPIQSPIAIKSIPLAMKVTKNRSRSISSSQIHQEFYADIKSASQAAKRESNEKAARLQQLNKVASRKIL
jgi:hypothetical protein